MNISFDEIKIAMKKIKFYSIEFHTILFIHSLSLSFSVSILNDRFLIVVDTTTFEQQYEQAGTLSL